MRLPSARLTRSQRRRRGTPDAVVTRKRVPGSGLNEVDHPTFSCFLPEAHCRETYRPLSDCQPSVVVRDVARTRPGYRSMGPSRNASGHGSTDCSSRRGAQTRRRRTRAGRRGAQARRRSAAPAAEAPKPADAKPAPAAERPSLPKQRPLPAARGASPPDAAPAPAARRPSPPTQHPPRLPRRPSPPTQHPRRLPRHPNPPTQTRAGCRGTQARRCKTRAACGGVQARCRCPHAGCGDTQTRRRQTRAGCGGTQARRRQTRAACGGTQTCRSSTRAAAEAPKPAAEAPETKPARKTAKALAEAPEKRLRFTFRYQRWSERPGVVCRTSRPVARLGRPAARDLQLFRQPRLLGVGSARSAEQRAADQRLHAHPPRTHVDPDRCVGGIPRGSDPQGDVGGSGKTRQARTGDSRAVSGPPRSRSRHGGGYAAAGTVPQAPCRRPDQAAVRHRSGRRHERR